MTWEEISSDSTGQFTDGGPYLLIYSRDGLRPVPPPSSPQPPRNVGVWGGMEGPGVHPAIWDSSNLIDIDDNSACRQTPLEPEHEEDIKDDMLAPGTTVTAVPVRSRRNTLESEALSRETTREDRSEGDKRPSTISFTPESPGTSRRATLEAAVLSPPSRKSSLSGGVLSPNARMATLSPSASRKSTLEAAGGAVRSPSRKASAPLDSARTPSRQASTSVDTSTSVLSPSRKNTHESMVMSPSRQGTDDTGATVQEGKREADGDLIME